MAEGGADSVYLVRGDAGAHAAAADQDAALRAAVRERPADGAGVVRIVDGVGAVGAHVQDFVAGLLEGSGDLVLQLVAAMVGADDDAHLSPLLSSYSQRC